MQAAQRRDDPLRGARAVLDQQNAAVVAGVGANEVGGVLQAEIGRCRDAGPQFVEHHLQPRQRAHAGDQRDFVDGLRQEVVGAGVEAAHAVGRLVERRHHHDRQMHRRGVGLEASADFESVHARHHDVEQHDVAAPFAT